MDDMDVFPSDLTNGPLVQLSESSLKRLKNRTSSRNYQVFIPHLDRDNMLHFAVFPPSSQHLTGFVAAANKACKISDFKTNVDFRRIKIRLLRSVNRSHRKNVDNRSGFKFENQYVVNIFFTFGQRTVDPGTAHVYQLLDVPLLLLVPSQEREFERRNGLFPFQDIRGYRKQVLLPNGCYRIPPGTTYLILSTQKNYFSVDVVSENRQIDFPWTDPIQNPVYKFRRGFEDDPQQQPPSPWIL